MEASRKGLRVRDAALVGVEGGGVIGNGGVDVDVSCWMFFLEGGGSFGGFGGAVLLCIGDFVVGFVEYVRSWVDDRHFIVMCLPFLFPGSVFLG